MHNTLKVVIIHTFPDCSQLTFGKKDSVNDWTIYLKRPNERAFVPTFAECLSDLERLQESYDPDDLYADFMSIYELVGPEIDEGVFNAIYAISQRYVANLLSVMVLFTLFYAFMVSDENNQDSKAGKCRCRLAVYMLLIENVDAKFVSQYMRKAKKNDILNICESKGF